MIELWDHQTKAIDFASNKNWRAMFAMEMGCGKTIAALQSIKRHAGVVYLIVCPNTIKNVWHGEIEKHFSDDIECCILKNSTMKKRVDELNKFLSNRVSCLKKKVVVTNYESISHSAKLFDVLKKQKWSGIICDESHRIANHQSKISKRLCSMDSSMRLCLSGTPIPGDPLKIFGQFKFIDESIFNCSFTKFRARYAVLKRIPSVPVPIVAGFKRMDELRSIFGQNAFHCKTSDVIDLPKSRHQIIEYEPSGHVVKLFNDMRNEMFAQHRNGVLTASNALVRLLLMQQLTNGYFGDEFVCDSRMKALAELFELIPPEEPIVVFARFKSDLISIESACRMAGRKYNEVSGKEKHLAEDGSMLDSTNVLGVQLQAGSEGISLVKSRFGIFYSKDFSFATYAQACARLVRPKQTRPVIFYHLTAKMPRSFDCYLNGVIQNKQINVNEILEEVVSK